MKKELKPWQIEFLDKHVWDWRTCRDAPTIVCREKEKGFDDKLNKARSIERIFPIDIVIIKNNQQ